MYFNTKTIAAFTLLSFAKKSIASSFRGDANEAQAKKFEEECGCSIDSLTGSTISCTETFMFDYDISISNFATEGSSYYLWSTYYYDSVASATEGVPVYSDDLESPSNVHRFKFDSSLPEDECGYVIIGGIGVSFYDIVIGCWICPTTPPTVFHTSSPSDSPSFGNDDENNDENNNESDDENGNDDENNNESDDENEIDNENNDCCEEAEVKNPLLWTIKNTLFVGN